MRHLRGYAVLFGTSLTLGYGYAAQAAIAADLADVVRRVEAASAGLEVSRPESPIWNGGTLAPIIVVAPGARAPGAAAFQLTPPADDCRLPHRAQPAAAAVARVS